MGLGTVLSSSFGIFKRQWKGLLGVSLVPALIAGVAAVVMGAIVVAVVSADMAANGAKQPSAVSWISIVLAYLAFIAVVIFASLKYQGMAMAYTEAGAQGRRITMSEAGKRTRGVVGRYLPFIGWSILFSFALMLMIVLPIMLFGGLALLTTDSGDQPSAGATAGLIIGVLLGYAIAFIAAYWFQTRTTFVLPVAALEHDVKAVPEAWGRTKGHFWRILGNYLVFSLVLSAISSVIVPLFLVVLVPLSATAPKDADSSLQFGAGAIVALVIVYLLFLMLGLVLQALTYSFLYALYLDTTRRQRGDLAPAFGYVPMPGYPTPQYGQPVPPQPPTGGAAPQWTPQPPADAPYPQQTLPPVSGPQQADDSSRGQAWGQQPPSAG